MTKVDRVALAVVGSLRNSPYPAIVESLGLSDRVHFLGFRLDIARLLRASDIFVFPSRYEPFSLVVLEALASGTPVITAATVGAAELITPACGTVLPDPDDIQALSSALHDWLAHPFRMRAAARAARETAENHDWSQMADAYLAAYENLMGRERQPA